MFDFPCIFANDEVIEHAYCKPAELRIVGNTVKYCKYSVSKAN